MVPASTDEIPAEQNRADHLGLGILGRAHSVSSVGVANLLAIASSGEGADWSGAKRPGTLSGVTRVARAYRTIASP